MNLLALLSVFNSWKTFINGNSALDQLSVTLFSVMIVTALICFIVGEMTRNYSQVDKIWSLMPIIYSFITLSFFPASPRIWIMTLLVTFWGLRLTYNFFRKGGYNKIPWKGEEDYRWGVLRQHPIFKKRIRLIVFNLLFISFYQHFLILLFSTPLIFAAKYSENPLSGYDLLASVLMFSFIMLETIADNQLFNFHKQKKNAQTVNGKYENSLKSGFMSEGLWKYMRHPNFLAEQAIWVSFYFFSVGASGLIINWTLAGSVLLILLFIGSSTLTENISMKKYPDYLLYKQNVPKFIPLKFKSK